KRDYPDSSVFITPTKREVDELIDSGCEVIAMDATFARRPDQSLSELVTYTRKQAADVELMADIANVNEALRAEELGFNYVSTTLHGYTADTQGKLIFENDFQFLKNVLAVVTVPVIAEGNIQTPSMLARV